MLQPKKLAGISKNVTSLFYFDFRLKKLTLYELTFCGVLKIKRRWRQSRNASIPIQFVSHLCSLMFFFSLIKTSVFKGVFRLVWVTKLFFLISTEVKAGLHVEFINCRSIIFKLPQFFKWAFSESLIKTKNCFFFCQIRKFSNTCTLE